MCKRSITVPSLFTYSKPYYNSIFVIPGTTFDIDVPFTYNLPDTATGLVFTGRSMEDDHAAVFEMAEDLLNKFVEYSTIWFSKIS